MPDIEPKPPEDSIDDAVERFRRIMESDKTQPASTSGGVRAPSRRDQPELAPPSSDEATPSGRDEAAPKKSPSSNTPTKPSPQSEKTRPEPPTQIHVPATSPARVRQVDIDEHGLPLPDRSPAPSRHSDRRPAIRDQEANAARPPVTRRPSRITWHGKAWRILQWLAILAAFIIAGGIIFVSGYVGYRYIAIARTLPPTAADLFNQAAAQFQTTRIYDRSGRVLYELLDPHAGRRTVVPVAKISPYLIAATIATEDRNFYTDPGFDPKAIVRALLQNTQEGETVSGASTITQQLVRALLLSPEERAQRTYDRKIREVVFAAEINRLYEKDEILELYLNEIYYGNLAYGIEAASETYFKKPADDLTLGEAALLAGLPQAPSVYDPYTNKQVVLDRMNAVLALMIEASGDCSQPEAGIYVITGDTNSRPTERICVTPEMAGNALAEMAGRDFVPDSTGLIYPHFVNYIRSLLEDIYGAQEV
ncbi:MAG: transglycosylase domain-containing protein, partial [Chloroflexi bacterium]|nr:transglycosylase domain-containing protein [Chloroflexota bacterium]